MLAAVHADTQLRDGGGRGYRNTLSEDIMDASLFLKECQVKFVCVGEGGCGGGLRAWRLLWQR